jgi:hypothetical protein
VVAAMSDGAPLRQPGQSSVRPCGRDADRWTRVARHAIPVSHRAAIVAILLAVASCSERATRAEPGGHADGPAGTPVADATPTAAPVGSWTVSARGLGPLRAGMTVAEAAVVVANGFAIPEGADTTRCGYANWPAAPAGVWVMLEHGRVVRVEVRDGMTATDVGARIGDREARIDSLYHGRVATTPGKYEAKRHLLVVTPTAPTDSAYRLIFETDGRVVTNYRAGSRPAVEYVEGCG